MGVRSQVALVTGYVPIKGHPRTAAEYGELGDNMFGKLAGDFYVHPFYETVQETWLSKVIVKYPGKVTWSSGDNSEKNTLSYHCVQHQKFAWLLKAKLANPRAKTLVWLDYGIGHLKDVIPDVVNEFMVKVQPDDFAMPGCAEREGVMVSDFFPCWRFCGGLMVVPANRVYTLYHGVKKEVLRHLKKTGNIPWEVNSLARAEPNLPPIRWYKADHDASMFTEYPQWPHA